MSSSSGGRRLPERIILVRHGESEGNVDSAAYSTTPDHQIPLTALGLRQAREAGRQIKAILSGSSNSSNGKWGAYFYVSPYARTLSTLRQIGRSFSRPRVLGAREECRIREQDFGNFQVQDRMRLVKEARQRFGRFFFRFPEGESAADVFDRVASFLESLWRDIDMNRLCHDHLTQTNLVIVTHGLTSRVFLMKWFKWTVDQFEHLNNPGNCEIRVMQLGPSGDYTLLIHHTPQELHQWGLSPEMITDQHSRATPSTANDFGGYLTNSFFDHLPDHSDSDSNSNSDSDSHCNPHPHPHPHCQEDGAS
ncbi:Phosphoglycerate mutase-like protein AT74 [Rhynchospora pubera]|uniref:Phosphoglycerate mutase-like protein AT74 n=1 Tax=Rhynchospora pubera TaxID=906938 RepID=A0AAV8DPL0_9POAL|nr:Phosphoglycerate mutase-like protein AT74 [Rhynchospora pubera]